MEREVMEAIYHAFQHWMLCACLAGLGMIAALLFLAKVAAPAWDAVRRWWSLPCIQRVIVAVCVVGLSYYGATKQGWHVGYDGGIKAGATANVVTNDTVSLHWQRDTSGGVYVPESAAVYIDYRPNTETNAEWGLLAQTTVGAWSWTGTVENATNYDYNVWAYYIPPEPVHTNGVWTYKTHFDRRGEYALPLRARIEVNGVAIATPAEKRKDAEKRPYDAEVEYLESTGTQWIDTGLLPSNDIAFESQAMVTGVGSGFSYANITGSRSSNTAANQFSFTVSALDLNIGNFCGWGAYEVRYGNSREFNAQWHTWRYSRDGIWVDGVSRTSFPSSVSITPTQGRTIWLFARRGNSGALQNPLIGKIRYATYSIGGVLVRDFIPVRVGTTGVLYDKRGVGGMNPDGTARNDGMYFNRGTGSFGYGNDK